jgi:hypothetical protein
MRSLKQEVSFNKDHHLTFIGDKEFKEKLERDNEGLET